MYDPEVDLGFGASVITPIPWQDMQAHLSLADASAMNKFLNQNTQNFTRT